MKWEIPQKAELGDTRIVEKFAYFPTDCAGNCNDFGKWTRYKVWLEHYTQLQKYQKVMQFDDNHGYYTKEWMKVDNTIIAKDKK
jgi:hypothetical protein